MRGATDVESPARRLYVTVAARIGSAFHRRTGFRIVSTPSSAEPENRLRNPIIQQRQFSMSANVHIAPPVGTLSAAKRRASPPPSPDATLTYCLPFRV